VMDWDGKGVRRLALLTMLMLTALCLAAERPAHVEVTLKEERTSVTDDPQRKGLEAVDRRLQMANLWIRYHLLFDPAHGNRPVIERYGDYFLACGFPPGTWNWNLEYFLDVYVARPNEKPFNANRATLQEGFYVLEEGSRGVADMVWPLPAGKTERAKADAKEGGSLSVRLVKVAADENWFYVEVALEGEERAQVSQVRLGAFPVVTTGPPERQRWATTLKSAYRLSRALTGLDAGTEWGVVLHNKNAQEEGGCLVVFDPDEMESGRVAGTYGVSLYLTPGKGRQAVHLALGYFWDTHYEKGVAQFRKEAPALLERLRRMNWAARLSTEQWLRQRQEIERLLAQEAVKERFGKQWSALRGEVERILAEANRKAAQRQPLSRKSERRFCVLMKQVRQLRAPLYEAALRALIEEATH